MKQAELINIGRDLILKAGLLQKPTEEQKKKFLKLLDTYEKKVSWQVSKYSAVVLWFITDIRSDIEAWREIDIDSIDDDEYLENYFIIKHELDIFNTLIDEKSFKAIFLELKKEEYNLENIKIALHNFDEQFQKSFKKLSYKNIAKNLLIFTTFDRKLPIPALHKVLDFIEKDPKLSHETILLKRLETSYKEFLSDFYNECLNCLKSKNISYKFIRYTHKNGKLTMSLKYEDASNIGLRSGDPIYEYKEILKKMW